ncbi:unnamed protein product [Effrenium voratum]|nr:unnamed protein product [Effrenium voratum]
MEGAILHFDRFLAGVFRLACSRPRAGSSTRAGVLRRERAAEGQLRQPGEWGAAAMCGFRFGRLHLEPGDVRTVLGPGRVSLPVRREGCDARQVTTSQGVEFFKRSNMKLRANRSTNGCAILLHSGVDRALTEMASETKWQDTQVAVASCCDVPPWAFELLGKFEFGPSRAKLSQVISTAQIHKGSKQGHLREIRDTVGCDFDDMIFFDNEPYNCDQVARLSVTCVYCPEGVTTEAWTAGIEAFPVPGSTIRC